MKEIVEEILNIILMSSLAISIGLAILKVLGVL